MTKLGTFILWVTSTVTALFLVTQPVGNSVQMALSISVIAVLFGSMESGAMYFSLLALSLCCDMLIGVRPAHCRRSTICSPSSRASSSTSRKCSASSCFRSASSSSPIPISRKPHRALRTTRIAERRRFRSVLQREQRNPGADARRLPRRWTIRLKSSTSFCSTTAARIRSATTPIRRLPKLLPTSDRVLKELCADLGVTT
jgi:hypothetical protein